MAINNREKLTRAFDLLAEGLFDVVDEAMTSALGPDWNEQQARYYAQKHGTEPRPLAKTDPSTQLKMITERGRDFNDVLTRSQQSYASELRETRNLWAHNEPLSSADTIRALDTMERLLRVIDATDSADDIQKMRVDLERTVFEDRTRKRAKSRQVNVTGSGDTKPWREVLQPHDDVARGDFTASEFAADLYTVANPSANNIAGNEYTDPTEFFERTYLTEGLSDLLSRTLRRVNGDANASAVVNLQTNFGGGKTHSMLALYHILSGTPASHFPQHVTEVVHNAGINELENLGVNRVVIVGTYLKPGSASIKDDGTKIHTMWGEIAWQLGGKEAYSKIAADDIAGTNPGNTLREIIAEHSPAIILIDEWVAYARQLLTERQLPAGTFDTQFSFAQTLTETIGTIPGAMLVISIPASDTADADRAGNELEIGGKNGQAALDRLQNVVRRVADQWRPSSKNESFEIVRRRLFKEPDAQQLESIASTARKYWLMYKDNGTAFPQHVLSAGDRYESRLRASYPLHPELLDRLYEDWSALERFQRTRGVLKLVSSIVHELWKAGDSSPMIMPGNVPLDAATVNTDLTQYLEDSWKPIIDTDIDGDSSTAATIDQNRPDLGQRHITRRLARTIFVGAAPRQRSNQKGLDKKDLWLGTAIPGDVFNKYGNALEQLGQRSMYFYEDSGSYWFDTQPSVSKTAQDRADQLREDLPTIWNEIIVRLRASERDTGLFDRIYICPESTGEIRDNEQASLVITHPEYSHSKNDGKDTKTQAWVSEALTHKGSSPRIHRNSLVFLVADKQELKALEEAAAMYMGWKSVADRAAELNLSAQQTTQTTQNVERYNEIVHTRLRDAFCWILTPEQFDPKQDFELEVTRSSSSGNANLAERASEQLNREEQLINKFGATQLGMLLTGSLRPIFDERGELSIGELWSYFTRYPYMPRLTNRAVLDRAIEEAVHTPLNPYERFAIASGKADNRYIDLLIPPVDASLAVTDHTLVVRDDIAQQQAEKEKEEKTTAPSADAPDNPEIPHSVSAETPTRSATHPEPAAVAKKTRYFGAVTINSDEYSGQYLDISREILSLLDRAGADISITVDIQADKPGGFESHEIRAISENWKTLNFGPNFGFEDE